MRYSVICFVLLCHILCAPSVIWRQKRISGGVPVITNKYPWVVYILMEYTTEPAKAKEQRGAGSLTRSTECTGSLIDIYGTILTAAHCVKESFLLGNGKITRRLKLYSVSVKWGSNVNYFDDHPNQGRIETVKPSMIYRHPKSRVEHKNDSIDIDFDVALVYLSRFQPSNTWNPIDCSPNSAFRPIELSKNLDRNPTIGRIAGFGSQPITDKNHSILRYTQPGRSNLSEHVIEYSGRLDETREDIVYINASVNASSKFRGYPRLDEKTPFDRFTGVKYSGPCDGDSGAPYMEKESGQTILRGIMSSDCYPTCETDPCIRADLGALYVDVNYPAIRRWVIGAIRFRYSDIGADTSVVPRTCPK